MILLDLVGPQTVFNFMSADVHLVGRTRDPVRTDVGVALQPTVTMDECPAELDILFVPGGLTGTVKLMDDKPTLDFLSDRGSRAKFVTSVCTGSLLLAAAGLLKGYRATSHWYVEDLLPRMGATVGAERVVVDRNRMTGGGVTAGIDFGLELARTIRDENFAKFVQLFLEYDPHPPVDAGSPEKAGREMADDIRRRRAPLIAAAEEAAIRAGARLKA